MSENQIRESSREFASVVLDRVHRKGRPLAVFVVNKRPQTVDLSTKEGAKAMRAHPERCVGVYDGNASVFDITADIIDFYATLE